MSTSATPVQILDGNGQQITNFGATSAVTIADGADNSQGAKADAVATTDTGTFSLIALFKRSLGYLSTIATGALRPTAGTNLSGTVTTTSGGFNIPANAARKPGDVQGQNLSAVTIGFNEFNGTAVIGAAGTTTVPAGATFANTTNLQMNFIAASGTAAVTVVSV